MHPDSEAMAMIQTMPKLDNGNKVDGSLFIEVSKEKGYCVCPRVIREVISFDGFRCVWCNQTETRQSWEFWYAAKTNSENP
jgi:hypothetical protein